jgi:hypothetical protein
MIHWLPWFGTKDSMPDPKFTKLKELRLKIRRNRPMAIRKARAEPWLIPERVCR